VAGRDRNRQESLRSFLSLCDRAGFAPEPFQKKIASAFFGPEPELLVLLPRGNGKSRLIGALAVHHLLVEPEPRIYVCAASREQAGVVHEYARSFARHVDPDIDVNQREIRTQHGYLRVVASDAGKLQGLTPSLSIVDELHAHRDADVYLAMRTALLKRPA
jgi:phage terminase large subunit-like protein